MKFFSDQNRTCFQYESGTYATTSGARQWIGLVQDHALEPNTNTIQIRYQGSTDRNVDDFADGNQEWNGTMTYYPQDWKMLGFAIGSIQDVTGSHIFTETNSDNRVQSTNTSLTTFTIEDSKNTGTAGSNFIRTTIGGMVNSFGLTAAQGEVVSCEVGYLAQSSTLSSGAIVALAATTTKPYMFNNVQLSIPSGTLLDNAKDVSFTVNNNLEPGRYLTGSKVLNEVLPMNRDYELTSTTDMDTSTAITLYESYYIGGSEFNTQLTCWGTAGSLTLTMSGCKMTEMGVPSPLEGVQEQSFTVVPAHVSAVVYDSITKYNAW